MAQPPDALVSRRSAHLALVAEAAAQRANPATSITPPLPIRANGATHPQRILLEAFSTALDGARDARNRPLALKTKAAYLRAILRAFRAARSTDPAKLALWASEQITPRTSKGSANTMIFSLKRYAAWRADRDGTTPLGMSAWPYLGLLSSGHRDALNEEELKRYYAVVEASGVPSVVQTILLLLPRTALRIEEIVTLRRCDVEAKNGSVAGKRTKVLGLRVLGKGSKVRWVPLGAEAKRLLLEYLDEELGLSLKDATHDEAPLFRTTQGTVQRWLRQLRTEHWAREEGPLATVSPHVLRHVWATHAIRRGVSIELVQKQLGHASYDTTVRAYVHLTDADLAEVAIDE